MTLALDTITNALPSVDTTDLVAQVNTYREDINYARQKICIINEGKVAGHLRWVQSQLVVYQADIESAQQQLDELIWAKYETDVAYQCRLSTGEA